MKFSKAGRILTALVASAALALGMTACGGGTIGYLYTVGTFYNQISGYKVDDYTGNLTAITKSPFSSGGTNPRMIAIKPGGRFLYVVNQGSAATQTGGTGIYTQSVPGSISEFSIGGDGTLTFVQNFQSQGASTQWATFDSTGNYLYVLDQFGPDATAPTNGSISAFSVASDTGRLSPVPNAAIKNTTTGAPTSFFTVGAGATMVKLGSGNCLYTLQKTSIFADAIGSAGQLTVAASQQAGGNVIGNAQGLTSINTGSSSGYVYVTDGPTNQIFSLQGSGTQCQLSPISASQQTNLPLTGNPVNSLTSSNGKFLYVINQSLPGVSSPANSSISAFTIDASGRLTTLADANNPYSIGSGPVCIVQSPDANGQYLYTSNNTDSTITGKLLNQNTGTLAPLSRGSVFPATKSPQCLAVTGNL